MLKQVLSEGRFSRFGEAAGSNALLLQRLQQLQSGVPVLDEALEDVVQAGGDLTLAARDANILYFCDHLFQECAAHGDMAPELLTAFLALKPALASFLLTHDDAVHSLQHPLFELLDQLWQAARYWDPSLGKQGDKYRKRIDDMLEQLRLADFSSAPVAEWRDSFSSQTQKDNQRAAMLVSRICETERSALATRNAEPVVRRQINVLLARTEMPAIVERLLKEPFRQSLHMIYLAHGKQSEKWEVAIHAIQCLQDSLLLPESEEDKKRRYQLIPLLPDMLRNALVSIGDPAEMESWLDEIETLHMQILVGNALPLQSAELLSALPDDAGVSANVSEALLEQVALIPLDNWVIYQSEDNQALRCRLVLKLEDAGQMLFVNVLGAKCLEKTFDELAYLLSMRQLRLMDEDNHFSQILRQTAVQLIQLYEKQSLLKANVREREAIEMERRRKAQEKARHEAQLLEQERIIAAERMAEQARVLEAERMALAAREDAERSAKAKAEAELHARENALQLSNSLGVGAWVEMEVEGVWQKCKLAAVINSSGKLIFTNREGRKVFEPKRDELPALILKKRLLVIETGSQFESSLQKVIQSLRND